MGDSKARRHRKHNKGREKIIERLDEFPTIYPVDIMFRDGKLERYHVYGVDKSGVEPTLLYRDRPLDPSGEYGSKLEMSDLCASAPLSKLGYVRNPQTGQKISLMAFPNPPS